MADLLYILVLIGFFALMILFVRVCERIVGPDTGAAPDVAADRPVTRGEGTG